MVLAWKACVAQVTEGSNPSLSAIIDKTPVDWMSSGVLLFFGGG